MRAAYRRSESSIWNEALEMSRGAGAASPSVAATDRAIYGTRPTNWLLIAAIVALHAALIVALVRLDVIHVVRRIPPPTIVTLLPDIAPPPPPAVVPAPRVVELKPVEQQLAPPVAIVQTPAPAPLAMAAAPPPIAIAAPSAPAAPAAAAPSVAPPQPVAIDANAATLAGNPPSYPLESRRRKEQGTVVLRILIGTDGRPEEVSLSQSSGFERLDKAALSAVRKWRFRPPTRDGQPAEGLGTLAIPFHIV